MRRWFLALAGVLVLAAGITYVALRPDTSPAPATRESLAAVAVDVLGIKPSSYVLDLDRAYGVRVNWHPKDSHDAHLLFLDIEDRAAAPERPCREDCVTYRVGKDEVRLDWDDEHVESDPGFLMVSVVREGEVRSLVYAGTAIHGDPRANKDLPFSVSKLAEVVLDPRFASTTTREMTSVDLDKWPEESEDDNAPVATTSTTVAHWMDELGLGLMERNGDGQAPTVTAYSPANLGEKAVGAEVRFAKWSATAVIVPSGSAPECGAGWHCRTRPHVYADRSWQVTTGWKRGEALVINHLPGRDVIATITSPTIAGFPHPGPGEDPVAMAVEAFRLHVTPRWSLTTNQGVLDAYADREPFVDPDAS